MIRLVARANAALASGVRPRYDVTFGPGEQADARAGRQLAVPADEQPVRGVVGDVIDEVAADVAGAERRCASVTSRDSVGAADVHRAALAVDQVLGRPVVAGGHRRPRIEAAREGRRRPPAARACRRSPRMPVSMSISPGVSLRS